MTKDKIQEKQLFTGIIETLGSVESIEPRGGDVRLRINTGRMDLSAAAEGESIAVSGVCLTALEISDHAFSADVSVETLNCTTLGQLEAGDPVNLESSLKAGDPLGGHLVTGHVDAVAEILSSRPEARSWRVEIALPERLAPLVAAKGSISVDGVSLTVNDVRDGAFGVNIVPHTRDVTLFGHYEAGSRVNLEIDVIARYIERMLATRFGSEQASSQ